MITKVIHAIGYACLAFSIIGFVEIAVGFLKTNTYNLLRAIIYSVLLGVALALV